MKDQLHKFSFATDGFSTMILGASQYLCLCVHIRIICKSMFASVGKFVQACTAVAWLPIAQVNGGIQFATGRL